MLFDLSDLAIAVGLILLVGGLIWVHPGWAVALAGGAIVSWRLGRAP